MEKFSNWRDKGTGISPFMPVAYPKLGASLPLNLVLFLIKVPFFLLSFPLVFVNLSLIKNFHLKFLFNFKVNTPKFQKNDFVITNYTSPLLIYLLGGVILIPDTDGTLYEYSILQLMNHSFGIKVTGTEVIDLLKYKNKVLFCLIEGTTTNNKAILKFIELKKTYTFEKFNLKTLVVKITPAYFCLPLPSSILKFFFYLLTNKPSTIALKLISHNSFDLTLSKTAFRNSNLHTVNFSITDKIEFYDYYLKNI